mmetsp:Transcript_94557/g.282379  ORF Transcript_94557/g.282379 Transcript_94557/m.282379 type:complete len:288 (-) Transcript_94557:622-1485(-)
MPLELAKAPSGCELWEAVLCMEMLCFCSAVELAPLKLFILEDLWLLLPPPIGGNNVDSSISSASPPPPGGVLRCRSRWLTLSTAAGGPAPGGSMAGTPAPLRRSCRMMGRPPARSSPEGVCGWLETRVTSGVWERPILAVLLLALMPSCCCSRNFEPRLPWSVGAEPPDRSLSASVKSLKYVSLRACRARIRSSGSYLMSFFISSTVSTSACGRSLSMPDPFFSGKLKSMWEAFRLNFLAKNSGSGVPRTLCIFWIWSISFWPGKSGKRATVSNHTQPAANRSILKL